MKKKPLLRKAELKELLQNCTSAENFLWKLLQKKQLADYKFRRKHSIFNVILDFYCPEKQIAIEILGTQQNVTSKEKETIKEKLLKQIGIRTIRLENNLIFENTEQVLSKIIESVKNK
ncbi:endonuclease domain-containing protein [Aureivirga marina]|uniref:endonuclease domain-containing protein n=1 Tax=Aureivirga marina TaxID=1182451 RepID=UPI0018CAB7A0|nr:DUF559 domain-containing protein [Aureivirga marina]